MARATPTFGTGSAHLLSRMAVPLQLTETTLASFLGFLYASLLSCLVLYDRGSFKLHVHARTHAHIKVHVWLIPTILYALIKKCALNNDVCLLNRVYGMYIHWDIIRCRSTDMYVHSRYERINWLRQMRVARRRSRWFLRRNDASRGMVSGCGCDKRSCDIHVMITWYTCSGHVMSTYQYCTDVNFQMRPVQRKFNIYNVHIYTCTCTLYISINIHVIILLYGNLLNNVLNTHHTV